MEENKNNPQNNNPPETAPIDGSAHSTSSGQADSQLRNLEEKLAKCEKERDEYLNGWKRSKADSINLQKDEMKRIEEIIKFANVELIKDLLLVLDSFELSMLATKDLEAKNSSTSSLQEGIKVIYSQFEKILNKQGLEKIKALGEIFDPSLHEAMMQEESDKESGTILEEMVKGWKLNGKVIRPTKVKISK